MAAPFVKMTTSNAASEKITRNQIEIPLYHHSDGVDIILMADFNIVVTPLLVHWNYHSFTLIF